MSKAQALAQHKAKPAAERKSGDGKLRGIPVDLESAVANMQVSPDVIIRVEDVPADARLSAGDATAGLVTGEEGQDKTSVWSLRVADLPGLHLLTTASDSVNYPLTIRVLMPDPDGYAYASTVAKFDILVTDSGGVSAFSSLNSDDRGSSKSDAALTHLRGLISKGRGKTDAKSKRGIDFDAPRAVPPPDEQRATAVLHQFMEEEDRREAERKRLADAEAEWRLHEDRRLAAARGQWEADTQQRIAAALEQARGEEEQRLAAAEARLKDRMAEQLVMAEARLKTKLARGRASGAAAVDVDAIEAAVTARLKAEFADEMAKVEA
ncbi:MAG: hypothetical protein ACREE7_15430, partial [Dongiaceae bacterium]